MHIDFIGTLIGGLGILLLPVVLPLFFYRNLQRRTLYYFIGLACCYLCYKVATFLWAFSAFLLGSSIASLRHESFTRSMEYSSSLILPGSRGGHPNMLLGLLPILVLGSLLSVIVLRKLKSALFKVREPVAL
jgi:hypothetical protein